MPAYAQRRNMVKTVPEVAGSAPPAVQARRTGRDSRPFIRLAGRQRTVHAVDIGQPLDDAGLGAPVAALA
jgi:hypothetical protein